MDYSDITNVPFCGVVTLLLNLLLQDKQHYEKNLPKDMVVALNIFESVLEESMTTGQDTSCKLHNLLLQLWHGEWASHGCVLV